MKNWDFELADRRPRLLRRRVRGRHHPAAAAWASHPDHPQTFATAASPLQPKLNTNSLLSYQYSSNVLRWWIFALWNHGLYTSAPKVIQTYKMSVQQTHGNMTSKSNNMKHISWFKLDYWEIHWQDLWGQPKLMCICPLAWYCRSVVEIV